MKKTLSLLAALLLSATLSAQNVMIERMDGMTKMQKAPETTQSLRKMAPSRINLAEGEKIMGFYTSDDLNEQDLLGSPNYPGQGAVGAIFPLDITDPFATGEMTLVRFAVGQDVGPSTVTVWELIDNVINPLVEQAVETTHAGWNEVKLSTPITMKKGTQYFISYTYRQDQGAYPLYTDKSVNPNGAVAGGIMILDQEQWASPGTQFGNLCIQAVVKGGSFIDYDIELGSLAASSTKVKNGMSFDFAFNLRNVGNKLVNDYKVKVTFNDQEVSVKNPALSNNWQTVKGSYTVPADLAVGNYKLKAEVVEINGEKPTQNIDNDLLSTDIIVYDKSFTRSKFVIEQLTSQYCTYCPLGGQFLTALCNERDDIALVAYHCDMQSGNDEFTQYDSSSLLQYLGGVLPGAAFNRFYIEDVSMNPYEELVIGIGYRNPEGAAKEFSTIIDAINEENPAFATVNINSEYNAETGNLDVTVYGEAIEGFKEGSGKNARITVHLTEDGLVGKQLNSGKWDNNYVHNAVYRKSMSDPNGDKINWTSETAYENKFSIKLDSKWNTENMHVVAFMNPQLNKNNTKDAVIINGNSTTLNGQTSGISETTINKNDVKEVARFTPDGRRVAAPVKGINLVKMSDGSVVKEVVK